MPATASSHQTMPVPSTDADLHVETRGAGPAVLLFGCPMDATAFEPMADLLAVDHTVITADPRGIKRSTVTDREADVAPETLADDLARILDHLDLAQASVFGSSGGAVAALAFATRHPERTGRVVAHEPPLEELLEDRAELRANTEDMVATYLAGDLAGAWIKFFEGADIDMPAEAVEAWIGGRTDAQELADEHFFFAHTLRPTTWWLPDIVALRSGAPQIVIGVGRESAGQVCDRTTTALAGSLGTEPVPFPGDHTGFVDHPEAFARQLASLFDGSATRGSEP